MDRQPNDPGTFPAGCDQAATGYQIGCPVIVDPEFEAVCSAKPLTELRVMRGQDKIYNRQKIAIIDKYIILGEAKEKAAKDDIADRHITAAEKQTDTADKAYRISAAALVIAFFAFIISIFK